MLDICACSWDTDTTITRSATNKACSKLIPHVRIIVGKTYTMWERGTKHSCLRQCLDSTDLLIGGGEFMSKNSSVKVNALSGSFMFSHLIDESKNRNLSMKQINELYLNQCIIGIIKHISPLTRVEASTEEFITRQNTKSSTVTRLQQMKEKDIPVYIFGTSDECKKSGNFYRNKAKIIQRYKQELRKLKFVEKNKSYSSTQIEQIKYKLSQDCKASLDSLKPPTRWDGSF